MKKRSDISPAQADASLAELLRRPSVEDIVLSPRGLAWFERGAWQGPVACDEIRGPRLMELARRIAEEASYTLGLTQPSVDAWLENSDGSCFRAHVATSPLAQKGPEITLRRLPALGRHPLATFCANDRDLQRLKEAVQSGRSILIAGSTGSGKTSLLTALLEQLPQQTRVLVLEDSPELPLPNALSAKLLARNDRFGFRNGANWDLSHLVFESLRMRPDRLVLGECRGPEALAIAHALQTGHAGVMTTLHAGSCEQALERFQALASGLPGADSATQYGALWELVVFITQDDKGRRRVRQILHREGPGRA